MAKVRQLLNAASVEVAKRQRICHRNRRSHSIAGGDRCLVVRDQANASKKSYCVECGNEILEKAADDLNELQSSLNR